MKIMSSKPIQHSALKNEVRGSGLGCYYLRRLQSLGDCGKFMFRCRTFCFAGSFSDSFGAACFLTSHLLLAVLLFFWLEMIRLASNLKRYSATSEYTKMFYRSAKPAASSKFWSTLSTSTYLARRSGGCGIPRPGAAVGGARLADRKGSFSAFLGLPCCSSAPIRPDRRPSQTQPGE